LRRTALLRPTSFHTTCPFKERPRTGRPTSAARLTTASLAYEAPISAAVEIAGFLSFYPNRTEVTVDGEVLTA
jgi:uncharacterized protein (DUF427 family)